MQRAFRYFIAALTGLALCVPALSADRPAPSIESSYAEHTRAVELARKGRHDEALKILRPLLDRFPDDYSLQRDYILIATWKGDCEEALKRFERVRYHPAHPPYLVIPVGDCLLEKDRPREAALLASDGLKRHPDDEALKHALAKAEIALEVEKGIDDARPELRFDAVTDESNQGPREWSLRAEASAAVAERLRVFGRYLTTFADDAAFKSGELHRAGLGLRYKHDASLLLEQEFSRDTRGGLGGSTTGVTYDPFDTWRLKAAYYTYAEGIPLLARANGIAATHLDASVEYNSLDYVWHWRAAGNRFDFSDGNDRETVFTTAGYAFELLPYREQRLFLEWYRSRNTLEGTPYFNPKQDRSFGVVYQLELNYETRFKRHSDRVYATLLEYGQEDFDRRYKWNLKYEQDYEFDHASGLLWGIEYGRNLYDATAEYETRGQLAYRRRF